MHGLFEFIDEDLWFLLRFSYVPKLESLRVIPTSKQIAQTFGNTCSLKTSLDIDKDQGEGCQRVKIIFSTAILKEHAYRCAVARRWFSESGKHCGCVLSHRAGYFLLKKLRELA